MDAILMELPENTKAVEMISPDGDRVLGYARSITEVEQKFPELRSSWQHLVSQARTED